MLRKLFTSAVLGLTLLSPLAAPQAANAADGGHYRRDSYRYDHHRRRHRCYEVFYRRDCYCEWRCAGRYDCREDAERAACRFRERGFEVSIRN
jgi:hypothetical protein